ncbi:hypothetical protein V8E36_001650 [Tilletia maclaganii]
MERTILCHTIDWQSAYVRTGPGHPTSLLTLWRPSEHVPLLLWPIPAPRQDIADRHLVLRPGSLRREHRRNEEVATSAPLSSIDTRSSNRDLLAPQYPHQALAHTTAISIQSGASERPSTSTAPDGNRDIDARSFYSSNTPLGSCTALAASGASADSGWHASQRPIYLGSGHTTSVPPALEPTDGDDSSRPARSDRALWQSYADSTCDGATYGSSSSLTHFDDSDQDSDADSYDVTDDDDEEEGDLLDLPACRRASIWSVEATFDHGDNDRCQRDSSAASSTSRTGPSNPPHSNADYYTQDNPSAGRRDIHESLPFAVLSKLKERFRRGKVVKSSAKADSAPAIVIEDVVYFLGGASAVTSDTVGSYALSTLTEDENDSPALGPSDNQNLGHKHSPESSYSYSSSSSSRASAGGTSQAGSADCSDTNPELARFFPIELPPRPSARLANHSQQSCASSCTESHPTWDREDTTALDNALFALQLSHERLFKARHPPRSLSLGQPSPSLPSSPLRARSPAPSALSQSTYSRSAHEQRDKSDRRTGCISCRLHNPPPFLPPTMALPPTPTNCLSVTSDR